MQLGAKTQLMCLENSEKHGPNRRNMILGSENVTHDILNLLGGSCCGFSASPDLGLHKVCMDKFLVIQK